MLKVIVLPVGPLQSNCYIVFCPEILEGVLIDPGEDPEVILTRIEREKISIREILLTHGHGDHIGACSALRKSLGIPVRIHQADAEALVNPNVNLSGLFGLPVSTEAADGFLEDGDIIPVRNDILRVIHTPGHTPGGVSFSGNGIVLTGDTLFLEGVGRTDLPGGSMKQLLASIRIRLFTLPDDTLLYPGHGPASTIGHEKRANPFL